MEEGKTEKKIQSEKEITSLNSSMGPANFFTVNYFPKTNKQTNKHCFNFSVL